MTIEIPYLTADIAPLTAVYKQSCEDFFVEELPLYELAGAGDHLCFQVEKRGMTTSALVRRIASELKVPTNSIGVAGLKDARAVTRQYLSVEHIASEALEQLRIADVEILRIQRHTNKLRKGHLLGNRFRIVLRDCDSSRIDDVRAVMARLEQVGLPNAFGPQRFGARGDSGLIGRALIDGNHREAVELIAGRPSDADFGSVLAARKLFEVGQYQAASKSWPGGYQLSAKISFAMHKNRGRASRATRSLSKAEKGFFISAWQAECFNRILAERMPHIAELQLGEFAWNHGGRRAFQVSELARARERARRFEVSPAGPLFGPATVLSAGAIGQLEARILKQFELDIERFDRRQFSGISGGRRPLRVRPTETRVETLGETVLELHFCLPAGAYATSVLREICKD